MKLADRIQRITESPTMAVNAKASAMKAAGIDVIDFSAGEPDFPTPGNVKEAGIAAIRNNFTKYTPAAGIKQLRELVARRYSKKYGQNFRAEEVIITSGAKQALYNLVVSLVQDGDEVLIPAPYWVTFPDQVRICGGTPVFVPTNKEQGFVLDAREIEKRITARTKVLILNSPNNPSGAVITPETMSSTLDICVKNEIAILFDETYDCFVFPPYQHTSPVQFYPKARDLTFIVNTFSKTYAMTGWRLGYSLGPVNVIAACDKLQSHTTSNPPSISQMAAVEALEGDQTSVTDMYNEYEKRRDFIAQALDKMPGVHCNQPQGAFFVFPDFTAHLTREVPDSVSLCKLLLEKCHVATVPGSAFGMEGHLRISYATSMQNLQEGCRRIQSFLESL